jgi:hypothetical protein
MKKQSKISGDWRKQMLARIRVLIKEADPKTTVEMKYKKASNPAGIPVWYHDGMICTGETYTNHLRLTFSKGYELKDPKKLLKFRGLIINEGDKLNEVAFKALIREAVAVNQKPKKKKPASKKKK